MKQFVLLALLWVLYGCNGTSGDNGPDPFGSGNTPKQTLTLALLDATCSSAKNSIIQGETLCVRATFKSNGQASANQVVSFAAPLGRLSTTSKLTDAQGVAQTAISSDTLGAATLTASSGAISATANYEFVANADNSPGNPSLTLNMSHNNQAVVTFENSQQVSVSAVLKDAAGKPLSGNIVRFSSTLGVLSPATALTNAEGIARSVLSAQSNALGADSLLAQTELNGATVSNSVNFQIVASNRPMTQLRMGHFNAQGNFVPNQLGLMGLADQANPRISAGGSLGLTVAIVDENDRLVATPQSVQFSSSCATQNKASLDAQVFTVNGTARATYQDSSCAGATGNQDVIVASAQLNGELVSIQQHIQLQAEAVGALRFVSATPQKILLAGTGGVNAQNSATLVFEVTGAQGNPLAQQQVSFSLNTQIGGLRLSGQNAVTNSQGQVSVRVQAGSVPTAVRVTASVEANGNRLQTQSELLTVNTGLPDQNSFSIAASTLNPEAFNIDGAQVTISVRLADTFNNPVPDGTAVSFTAEGGSIDASCQTTGGACQVVWRSQSPRPSDHRVTVLATAIGHETFYDANGNNQFDAADGGALPSQQNAGFADSTFSQSGFVDMSEAWRDDNENGVRDADEPIFLDYNADQAFSPADGLFNGPQCDSESSNLCGQGIASSIHVRKALVLVMSSSRVLWSVYTGNVSSANLAFSNNSALNAPQKLSVPVGQTRALTLVLTDTAGQMLPEGSILSLVDETTGNASSELLTVPKGNFAGGSQIKLADIDNRNGTIRNQRFVYQLKTPSGALTHIEFRVNE